MKSPRRRLDQLLVDRGLAPTRTKAQALILAGQVRIVGSDAPPKAGTMLPSDAELDVAVRSDSVGRGREKFQIVLDAFAETFRARRCGDIGASTGGFTQAMLAAGASRVVAFDVGKGLLDSRLRSDPRVDVREGINFRRFEPEAEFAPLERFTVDVSFISVTKLLTALTAVTAPGSIGFVLVKPQFELEPGKVSRGGVVREADLQCEAIRRVWEAFASAGWAAEGVWPASLAGRRSGNQEFFVRVWRL